MLLVAHLYDFATDYVVAALRDRGASYLRLNRDEFPNLQITLDPCEPRLTGDAGGFTFSVEPDSLRSIWFRAPVFLREPSPGAGSVLETFSHQQWAAFVRALMVFERAIWVNHPRATYAAESKPLQLYRAARAGLRVPRTAVANEVGPEVALLFDKDNAVVAKSLDTALLSFEGAEAFIYTNTGSRQGVLDSRLSDAPVVFQERLHPKTDVRATVVGDRVFAARILRDGRGVEGDWRLAKDEVQFVPTALPPDVAGGCAQLVRDLDLLFGAIDLAIVGEEYYFLELNPTGEWAWLVEEAGMNIHRAVAEILVDRK